MNDEGRFGTFGENPELPGNNPFSRWEEDFGKPKSKPHPKKGYLDFGSNTTPKKGSYAWHTKESLTGISKEDLFAMNLAEVIDEVEDIVNFKQADYGSNAILGSPYGALNGIIVRMHDKMNRAVHLEKSKTKAKNESLRDTFVDLAGYALLAVLVIDERFPKE